MIRTAKSRPLKYRPPTDRPPNVMALLTVVCLFVVPAGAMADAASADTTLPTRVSLLIGFPEPGQDGGSRGVLVVPGTVLPIRTIGARDKTFITRDQEHSLRMTTIGTQLVESFNLARFEVAYSNLLHLDVDETRSLPGPSESSQLSLQVQLLGFNDQTASYEAKMFERSAVIAEPKVIAERGKQAVIGSTNGEEAPYLFLVIEPAPRTGASSDPRTTNGPLFVGGDVLAPRAIVKTPPQYTEEARKDRTQGVVIVQATISDTGTVDNVKVLKELPQGLTEAAVEAISTWRFEPATLNGKPVAVYYNLTVNFRLDPGKKADE